MSHCCTLQVQCHTMQCGAFILNWSIFSLLEPLLSLVVDCQPTWRPPLQCPILSLVVLLVSCPQPMVLKAAVVSVAYPQDHLMRPLHNHPSLRIMDAHPQCILLMKWWRSKQVMDLAWQVLLCSHLMWLRTGWPLVGSHQRWHLELVVLCDSWVMEMTHKIVSGLLPILSINNIFGRGTFWQQWNVTISEFRVLSKIWSRRRMFWRRQNWVSSERPDLKETDLLFRFQMHMECLFNVKVVIHIFLKLTFNLKFLVGLKRKAFLCLIYTSHTADL